MARDGWFMPTFFVPVSGTARTVFASMSGIPDVSTYKTASRNPLISHQRSIVNELQGYEKLYFGFSLRDGYWTKTLVPVAKTE